MPDVCIDCVRQPPPAHATLAALDYGFPWSGLIARFKYGERPGWAPFFAGLMLDAPGVRQALNQLGTSDLLLPLPLSRERLQQRGFNQSWELANALARHAAVPARVEPQLLLRIRDTRAQSELQRGARLANVRGAFAVDPLRQGELTGRRVVLVDDVLTTGASVFTAARALMSAGAAHVTVLTLARTPAAT